MRDVQNLRLFSRWMRKTVIETGCQPFASCDATSPAHVVSIGRCSQILRIRQRMNGGLLLKPHGEAGEPGGSDVAPQKALPACVNIGASGTATQASAAEPL